MKCEIGDCRDLAVIWCHARCCSGEVGMCMAHYNGSRHERMLHYEQFVGGVLPETIGDCLHELIPLQGRIQKMQYELADNMRVEKILMDEVEALRKAGMPEPRPAINYVGDGLPTTRPVGRPRKARAPVVKKDDHE